MHVRDANRQKVVDALVYGTWVLPDGSFVADYAYTSFNGVAQFSTWAGKGTYQFQITNVVKEGWVYSPVVQAAYPLIAR